MIKAINTRPIKGNGHTQKTHIEGHNKARSEVSWKPIAFRLRNLLDDISTASDMCKGDYETFHTYVMAKVKMADKELCSYDGYKWEVPREEDE